MRRPANERGAALVEASLVMLLAMIVVLGVLEVGRLVLVYTTLAQAARAGTRYAIVHGAAGPSPSGPAANPPNVVLAVTNMTDLAGLSGGGVTVTVTYPDSTNTVASRVIVTAAYAYVPFWSYLPLTVNLASTSQGMICF